MKAVNYSYITFENLRVYDETKFIPLYDIFATFVFLMNLSNNQFSIKPDILHNMNIFQFVYLYIIFTKP